MRSPDLFGAAAPKSRPGLVMENNLAAGIFAAMNACSLSGIPEETSRVQTKDGHSGSYCWTIQTHLAGIKRKLADQGVAPRG
jgi:hypothetical protein